MNKSTIGYILMIAVMIGVAFISLSHFFMVRTDSDRLDINSFPRTIDSWQSEDLTVTEKEYEILETRNLISRDYVNTLNNKRINLFIIYSETNRSVFHPPEVCLIGSGISIVDKKAGGVASGKNGFSVNELFLEKNDNEIISLYCYSAGDLYTDNFWMQQARFAFNQLLNRHVGGATIRVSMPVTGSKEETMKTLKQFMTEVVGVMKGL